MWYHTNGHSVSRPTLAKVADFLYWLRYTRGLSVSSLHGYRSVLSAVFRFHLPSLSSDPVIRDLLRSFRLSSAERVLRPPAWDLSTVLTYFVSHAFEPCLRLPSALSRCRPCFCWLLPLPRELVRCRLYLPLSPLWLGLPACLTSRSLSPSRSRSPVPSLTPSWCCP